MKAERLRRFGAMLTPLFFLQSLEYHGGCWCSGAIEPLLCATVQASDFARSQLEWCWGDWHYKATIYIYGITLYKW